MKGIKEKTAYKVKQSFFNEYLDTYWFIPSDVLQRSIEANVWDYCELSGQILEIGSGNGEISSFLFKNHPQISMGIDIDGSQLDTAIKTGIYKNVRKVDASSMPFADKSFSCVVSNSSFEHIARDKKAIAEVARVLKKDGLCFLTLPNTYLQEWIYSYEKEKNPTTAKQQLKKFNNRANHLHYRTLEEWKEIFANHNMTLVFHKYYFPKKIALLWYTLFCFYTMNFRGREMWSYLQHSFITRFIPITIVKLLMKRIFLEAAYKKAFFTKDEELGGQMFLVAKKTS